MRDPDPNPPPPVDIGNDPELIDWQKVMAEDRLFLVKEIRRTWHRSRALRNGESYPWFSVAGIIALAFILGMLTGVLITGLVRS